MKISFPLFAVLWNQMQGQTTPTVHLKMAQWLEQRWMTGDHSLLLMAFRSCGKSTLVGLFCAWLLFGNPNLRILILAADELLARKMVRNVKRIIERHPLTIDLKPDNPDQWATERFTVARDLELRDPSMLARGVTSNITGSRADVVICDDVEVPNTSDSVEKRTELRERLAEIDFVLVPGGTQLYVGTPHTYDTLYRTSKKDAGAKESTPFLEDFKKLVLPILVNGKSQWDARFSLQDIAAIKKRTGPNKFASQMMLQPVNIADSRLNPDLMTPYNMSLSYQEAGGGNALLSLGDTRLVSASAWWDPAFGSARGDNSVLAIVYSDAEGHHFLHHIEIIKNAGSEGEDEATTQCRCVVEAAKSFYLPSITIEINGLGRFLPAILRRELAKEKVSCAVKEVASHIPKHIRILEAFDVALAARALRIHTDIRKTPFIQEMRDWRPGSNKGHDDCLDAVAGALGQEPVRIKRQYGGARQAKWTQGAASGKAITDFEV